jgi:glycosyltransferase involved in cell wall biosynthesis
MFKDFCFVVMGYQSWDIEIGSNCKNLAIELAKNNKVLYINLPIDRKAYYKLNHNKSEKKRISVLRDGDAQIEKVSDNLWSFYPKTIYESVNWIGLNSLYDFLNKRNSQRLCSEIRVALGKLNFEKFILFNDSDMFRGVFVKQLLKPDFYIYYIRDNLISQSYFQKHGSRTEPITIKNADLVVANSTYLADYSRKYNRNSHYVGQGCDLEIYSSKNQTVPEELSKIIGVKIGYVGYLTEARLDIDLIQSIAESQPSWNIILVGPTDDAFQKSDLHKLENVYFLGSRDIDMLPSYIYSFDVCINPQELNDLTVGNYPRKIDEYLSMGKPTVATLTPAMQPFEKHVYLASGLFDYVRMIKIALEEDDSEKQAQRISFAAGHSWENNLNQIYLAYENSVSAM